MLFTLKNKCRKIYLNILLGGRALSNDKIVIKGARENNLKNMDVTIPRDKLVVFTGLSGSGKSSLAFDTIYAEGQRRYVESLSSYARQFLGQMEKPNVDSIDGLSPAISIDQKTTSKNPRSTVGTVTEIYDYLRLLFARIGKPYCPKCGKFVYDNVNFCGECGTPVEDNVSDQSILGGHGGGDAGIMSAFSHLSAIFLQKLRYFSSSVMR